MATVEISLKFDDDTLHDAIIEALKDNERLESCYVGVFPDSAVDYATYIELGTGPARARFDPKNSYKSRGQKSPVLKEYEEWVEMKLGLRGKEAEAAAERIYRAHMRSGMPPLPFFRPAIHNVLHRLEGDQSWWIDEDGSIEKIAEMIRDEAKRILEENGSVFTGTLRESLEVRKDDGMEYPSVFDTLDRKILDSDRADYTGDESRYNKRMRR